MADEVREEEPEFHNTPREAPPRPANDADAVYLYRLDPESKLPVVVGKVFVDENRDAWVRINETDLAAGIGVENIDGVSLHDRDTFNGIIDS